MKNKMVFLWLILLLLSVVVLAQSGGSFEISKSTLDAGGGHSEGGVFVLDGTVGQADASEQSQGGVFTLNGGFWSQGVRPDALFKDGFEN